MEHITEEYMKIEFAKAFEASVQKTIEQMVKDNLTILEVETSNGMVVVRKGSEEHKERDLVSGRQIKAISFGGGDYILCHN